MSGSGAGVLQAEIVSTGWRVNDVEDYRGSVSFDCRTAAARRFQVKSCSIIVIEVRQANQKIDPPPRARRTPVLPPCDSAISSWSPDWSPMLGSSTFPRT